MNGSHSSTLRIVRHVPSGLGACLVLAASMARAQGVDEFGAYGTPQEEAKYESPQNWMMELRIGAYYPEVDKEFNGTAYPLANSLGDGNRVMVGIEGDWEALRLGNIASLGPGFGMGYTRLSNNTTFYTPPDLDTKEYDLSAAPTGRSPMDSSLKLWVQWAAAVAHIDALNRNFGIPIVFTAKLGMGHALWWASKGNLAGRANGMIGHGRSWGGMWALGAMFDLNFVQGERARKLDAVSGINHMYLFGEWYQLKLNGFGSGDQLLVGDSTWTIGYAVEF